MKIRNLILLPLITVALSSCGGGGSSIAEESFISGNGSVSYIKQSDRIAAPELSGMTLSGKNYTFSGGQVAVVNVWASWCVSCREEHPLLVELSKSGIVPIYGLNYKDKPELALQWLGQYGDPYTVSVVDPEGRIGIDYGVYGVPETYVIDKDGVIRHKQIGPVTIESLEKKILPLIKELQG